MSRNQQDIPESMNSTPKTSSEPEKKAKNRIAEHISIPQNSPNHLRMSLAAAMTLGLKPGIFYRNAQLHCLNLLLTYDRGCAANCSYCGLRRDRTEKGPGQSFIRVQWPTYALDQIIEHTLAKKNLLKRICVSMIMRPEAWEDTLYLTERLTRETGLPVSVLANPSTMPDGGMKDLQKAGAHMVSVAIDAATPQLFDYHRGKGVNGPHKWDNYWSSLQEAALAFGKDRAGCHLICGLGETERQMADAIQRVRDMGGRSHLFSFYPEEGSLLAGEAPCPAGQFRRVQLARFLIDYDMSDAGMMDFDDEGRITGFGLKGTELDAIVSSGGPFMTSGCPGDKGQCDCNRPFGDGPPSDIRSYPFVPQEEDIRSIRKELATYPQAAPAGEQRQKV